MADNDDLENRVRDLERLVVQLGNTVFQLQADVERLQGERNQPQTTRVTTLAALLNSGPG